MRQHVRPHLILPIAGSRGLRKKDRELGQAQRRRQAVDHDEADGRVRGEPGFERVEEREELVLPRDPHVVDALAYSCGGF
jgi:hypothetical protein